MTINSPKFDLPFLSLHVLSHVQPQSVFSVLLISVLMSILKYFKRAPKTASDELLPDPDGTLSKIRWLMMKLQKLSTMRKESQIRAQTNRVALDPGQTDI